jgi:hypothetical protein
LLRIEANYNDHVSGKEDDFLKTMRTQLANLLNTEENNIRNLDVKDGSIIVFFRLVGFKDQAGTLDESYKEFVELLTTGKLKLVIKFHAIPL